jgi:hypothetical protein
MPMFRTETRTDQLLRKIQKKELLAHAAAQDYYTHIQNRNRELAAQGRRNHRLHEHEITALMTKGAVEAKLWARAEAGAKLLKEQEKKLR